MDFDKNGVNITIICAGNIRGDEEVCLLNIGCEHTVKEELISKTAALLLIKFCEDKNNIKI